MALTLQRTVRALDGDLPVTDVRTMETRIDDSLLTRRSPALLAALFSAIAVLLTALGTYGVLSYSVAQRRREIAVRMALGARPEQIRGQFLAIAVRLLIVGLLIGLVGAWMTGQAMQAILFKVPAFNAMMLGATGLVMAVVCLIACLLPSHRAARTSPAEALAE
jgi:ABC-type antimicrobial peptide transport system permease subunit